MSFLLSELVAKEVELLHELVPKAAVIGFLANPRDPNYESDTKGAQAAADALGHKLVVVKASTESEIDPAFAALARRKIAALFVNADPLFVVNSPKILALATRHAMLTVSSWEGFAADGGLINYGTSIKEANRQTWCLYGPGSQGHPPWRSAGRAADQIPTGDQPQDRQSARADDSAVAAGPGGSGD